MGIKASDDDTNHKSDVQRGTSGVEGDRGE